MSFVRYAAAALTAQPESQRQPPRGLVPEAAEHLTLSSSRQVRGSYLAALCKALAHRNKTYPPFTAFPHNLPIPPNQGLLTGGDL
jgi:hypothetical protein